MFKGKKTVRRRKKWQGLEWKTDKCNQYLRHMKGNITRHTKQIKINGYLKAIILHELKSRWCEMLLSTISYNHLLLIWNNITMTKNLIIVQPITNESSIFSSIHFCYSIIITLTTLRSFISITWSCLTYFNIISILK